MGKLPFYFRATIESLFSRQPRKIPPIHRPLDYADGQPAGETIASPSNTTPMPANCCGSMVPVAILAMRAMPQRIASKTNK